MLLPLYVLDPDEGIPIPTSGFVIQDTLDELGFLLDTTIDQFVIGIERHYDDDLVRPVNKTIYSVGVLVRKTEVGHAPIKEGNQELAGVFAKVDILGRVILNRSTINTAMSGPPLLMVQAELIKESAPNEKDLFTEMDTLLTKLAESPTLYKRPIASLLKPDMRFFQKMDAIADYVLRGFEERNGYLQELDNEKRFQTTVNAITTHAHQVKLKKKKERAIAATSPEEKLAISKAPRAIKKKLELEIERLKGLNKQSAEYAIVEEYLRWSLDIPWSKTTSRTPDLKKLPDLLHQSHYGLDDVKEHILEHMTIEKITGGSAGTVFCFVGPPGTGKTSIAKQVAAATNRSLQRVALGGVGDEAEIRGHRRTYVGARPGRFIVGLKDAGSMDPLFLLDEIDKLSTNERGSPAAALLELLDPEQNNCFIDRYLEYPVDLSKAMFICTANEKSLIPGPLLDRMEFIYFRAYTYEERLEITKRFIIPKATSEYAMQAFKVSWDEAAIQRLADEVQVRQIEKKVRKLLRKAAVDIEVKDIPSVIIDVDYVGDIAPKKEAERKRMGFV